MRTWSVRAPDGRSGRPLRNESTGEAQRTSRITLASSFVFSHVAPALLAFPADPPPALSQYTLPSKSNPV